jgi:hypothetical protein
VPYNLYAADFDSQAPSPYLSPFVFDTQERAVEAAFKLLAHSKIVWRITGPDEFELGRQQIERMHWEKTHPTWPPANALSTGGMPSKQHRDRSMTPPPRPYQRRTPK